ncbi:MAG: metallophosphoesterase family protein [Nitrospiraceae bacterium]|jgi:putative phosphoesterase|nr:MAG: metallophosphoesterase family protein [Nitrospiraceae bacterium]
MKTHGDLKGTHTVGIISDTHGLLRPEAFEALKAVNLIIHAGDVGSPSVIDDLKAIAPVIAVRGNMDRDPWAADLPVREIIELEHGLLYVAHDLSRLESDPNTASVKAVISGHSHRPSIKTHKGVLYLNPGSAGPRRFTLPVTIALLHINGKMLDPHIVTLNV